MRTVICHFYNEEYLLPWWLKHHREVFDHGVMINHASTDRSLEIIRDLTPSWKIINTTLLKFDVFLTDFEVMQYERAISGWKIALNVTEFIMSSVPLNIVEADLLKLGKTGCALSGVIMADAMPASEASDEIPLPLQYFYGVDENTIFDSKVRFEMGLNPIPARNRFYHCNEVGMYEPGRHRSYHPDFLYRTPQVMVFAYGFAPWNNKMKARKLQIKPKLKDLDLKIGWGTHHAKLLEEHEVNFLKLQKHATDLRTHPFAGLAISNSCTY